MRSERERETGRISNKIIFVSIVLVLLAIGVYAYTQQIPNPGHGADEILISVNDFTMTLQEAIDNAFLVDGTSSPTQDYTTEISGAYQTGDEIYVSVSGSGKTLQQAISTSLCGSGSYSYSSGISLGHSASEVLVSVNGVEMTLQNAINSGEFCCASNYGDSCGGSACVNAGIVNCEGDCVGETNKPIGTSCGIGKVCDANGVCINDVFTGCSCDAALQSYKIYFINGAKIYVDCENNKCWTPKEECGYLTWYDARDCCQNLNHGGFTDWYFPDMYTLQNLCYSSACPSALCFNSQYFPTVWSANLAPTTYARCFGYLCKDTLTNAYTIPFYSGCSIGTSTVKKVSRESKVDGGAVTTTYYSRNTLCYRN